jgi:hypothetical protein
MSATALMIMAVLYLPPSQEDNTFYIFTTSDRINAITGLNWGAIGCAYPSGSDYIVMIDQNAPAILQHQIIKHENCHVRQFKELEDMSDQLVVEGECYLTSILP